MEVIIYIYMYHLNIYFIFYTRIIAVKIKQNLPIQNYCFTLNIIREMHRRESISTSSFVFFTHLFARFLGEDRDEYAFAFNMIQLM